MNVLFRRVGMTGAILGMLAVALGAFGAHGLKASLSSYGIGIFSTAVDYQMYHALAVLMLAALMPNVSEAAQKTLLCAFYCFVFGLLFFCGSLYALAVTEIKWLGAITPIGGVAFLVGWGLLIFSFYSNTKHSSDHT